MIKIHSSFAFITTFDSSIPSIEGLSSSLNYPSYSKIERAWYSSFKSRLDLACYLS